MSLTIFYGLLTLAPLALGVALAALGLAHRATRGIGVALAILGVLLPLVGVAWLAAEVSPGYPVEIPFWGGASSWLAIYARADALGAYAGLGIAAIVIPLLLWVAWRAAPPDASEVPAEGETDTARPRGWASRTMGRWQWTGVALVLALESCALSLVFAENIAWLVVTWLLVIGVSWALGELGSDPQALDWKGLALMAIGPLIWLVTTLLIAAPAGDRRLIDLMGSARFPMGHVFVMTLAVAVAAGAWPALGWVRKRASITAPAGLGAVMLATMPLALFMGARTFSITQTAFGAWPEFAVGKPPITIGVFPGVLGAVTVLFAGLLALGRRDGRSLLASSALASAGWGLLGLGIGAPLASLGVTLLLATAVLGLGAMLASLVACGAVTADLEPDSAGPRVFGEPARPAALFAWVVGAASVVGLPLFAGFTPLQIISGASLSAPRIMIPLVGLAWAGAALLLIGLTRATAPAFATPVYAETDASEESTEEPTEAAVAGPVSDQDAETDGETDGEEPEVEPVNAPDLRADDLPAVALGVVALIAGVAPAALLLIGSVPAAVAFSQAGALDGATRAEPGGYVVGVGQWLATPAVLSFALIAIVLTIVRWRLPRAAHPASIFLGGQSAADLLEGVDETPELEGLSEPEDAWDDLRGAQRSGWLTPGAGWLGVGADEAEGEPGAADESLALEGQSVDAVVSEDDSNDIDDEAEPAAESAPDASDEQPSQEKPKAPGARRGE